MSQVDAAHLSASLLLIVSAYAGYQLLRGGLDPLMRAGLVSNLVGVIFVWLRANHPVEGPILFVVSSRHGVTLADTLSLPSAALVVTLLWGHVGSVLALLKRR